MGLLDWIRGRRPPVSALHRAICAVADNDTPQNRAELYRHLLEGVFVVQVTDYAITNGTHRPLELTPGFRPEFPLVQLLPGQAGFAIFSDVAILRTWRPNGSRYVMMQGRNFFTMALDKGATLVVVDPTGPVHGFVKEMEIRRLAEGLLPINPAGEGRIQFTDQTRGRWGALPTPPPDAVVQGFCDAMAANPQVAQGYLFEITIEGGRPRLALAVRFDPFPDDAALDRIMQQFVRKSVELKQDMFFFPLNETPWLAGLEEKVPATYERNIATPA